MDTKRVQEIEKKLADVEYYAPTMPLLWSEYHDIIRELIKAAAIQRGDGHGERIEREKLGLAYDAQYLRGEIQRAIDYAGGRESEWGERAESAFEILYAALSVPANEACVPSGAAPRDGIIGMPQNLNANTKRLVENFATALATKLFKAEQKYGYSDGWMQRDWMDECRTKLRDHLEKGDPRDVAAYCAFLWYHNEPTATTPPSAKPNETSGATPRTSPADERLKHFTQQELDDAAGELGDSDEGRRQFPKQGVDAQEWRARAESYHDRWNKAEHELDKAKEDLAASEGARKGVVKAMLKLSAELNAVRAAGAEEVEKLRMLYASEAQAKRERGDIIAELNKYKVRLNWLHTGSGKDASGCEWGVYRVKYDANGQPSEAWHTNADLSDLDAEILRENPNAFDDEYQDVLGCGVLSKQVQMPERALPEGPPRGRLTAAKSTPGVDDAIAELEAAERARSTHRDCHGAILPAVKQEQTGGATS